ncbi:MAG TPA: hypothetical protein VFV34_19645, partial [Blastocatellia bacterium]|nr:hypothetical protein [Blastocatellia bacterium]
PVIPPPLWFPRALGEGGRLWLSKGLITGKTFAKFVEATRRKDTWVTILTATHGDRWGRIGMGELWGEAQLFLREDIAAIARNGHAAKVRVLDVTRLSEKELRLVLSGGGDIYAGWCNSSLSRAINRALTANAKKAH